MNYSHALRRVRKLVLVALILCVPLVVVAFVKVAVGEKITNFVAINTPFSGNLRSCRFMASGRYPLFHSRFVVCAVSGQLQASRYALHLRDVAVLDFPVAGSPDP